MSLSFRKNWHIWTLVAIMLVAFFVRSWQLEETLYFKMDQARDATIAMNAYNEGPGMLTLLGPRAAGSFLRLGPVFYYFQYLSSLLFGSVEPHVMVFPNLLFSLLTIPLLYYFLRQFFLRETSVLISGLYSFSFLATQYSRFAWNPNQTPFWGLMFVLGLYKSATSENKKQAGWWLLVAAVGYGVVSQLHFTSLLALPLVAGAFWLFFRPRGIKIYFWVVALGVLSLFYAPMFISELATDWDNLNQFKYALTAKSQEYPILEKVEQSLRLHGQYHSLALTSYGNTKDSVFVWFFLFLVGFGFWRGSVLWKEGDRNKRAFLMLIGSLFTVFGLLYTKLAFTVLKPRFWLLIVIVAYVILAMLFEWLCSPGKKKRGRVAVAVIVTFLLGANFFAVGFWYQMLASQKEGDSTSYGRELVLKQKNLVGLKQMKQATAQMVKVSGKTGRKICFYTEGDYRSPYEYIIEVYFPGVEYKRISFGKDTNESCTFFSIEHGLVVTEVNLPRDHDHEFFATSRDDFGKVTIWSIEKKTEEEISRIEQQQQDDENEKVVAKKVESNDVAVEERNDKPRRKERVFWKDIWNKEE
ncbi:MAG: glycosyltransferase family 39 protein [Patescibacteria group bacterium]|nr:glycosyltransferase family 39 protein [Patescibacteria group bacterium]